MRRERLADVARRGERIRVAVRALGVHVDEAHLHRTERTRELAVAAVALVAEPRVLRTPETSSGSHTSSRPNAKPNVLKPIDSSATLPASTSRSAHEIFWPYFCLIGHSSRRALSRLPLSGQLFSGANRCAPSPAPPRPSSMRYVPAACQRHADEQRAVVAVVGRPPLLRRRHHLDDVPLQRVDVERLRTPRRSRSRRPSGSDFGVCWCSTREVELVRPPVLVRARPLAASVSATGSPGSRSR